MKILILADMDDFHWEYGQGTADVILACGDMYDQLILEAAQAYACNRIYAVKGNHDTDTPFPQPIQDLHLQVCEQDGIRFGGINGSWRYKPAGHFMHTQEAAQSMLGRFPAVDILLSHNSPQNVHERGGDAHSGFTALNSYIQRTKPALVIHGHQHINSETVVDRTRVIGVHGHKLIEFKKETT